MAEEYRLVGAVHLCLSVDLNNAVEIARELCSRYPDFAINSLIQRIQAGGIAADESGYYIFPMPIHTPFISKLIKGDRACKFSANSPLLRCAVNPKGSCESCQHFESKD